MSPSSQLSHNKMRGRLLETNWIKSVTELFADHSPCRGGPCRGDKRRQSDGVPLCYNYSWASHSASQPNLSFIIGWTNLKIILKFNSKFFLYLLWSWAIALINLFSCFYIFEDNEEGSKDSSVNVIKVTIVTSLNHHHKSQTCTILNIPRQRSPTIK